MKRIDVERLKKDIADLVARQRELRVGLGIYTGAAQATLLGDDPHAARLIAALRGEDRRLSRQVTRLCALRAHARDRLHMRTLTRQFGAYGFGQPIEVFTRGHQATLIGELWREYDMQQ